jgi:hypothetical protein
MIAKTEDLHSVIEAAWDFTLMRKVMEDLNLDLEKLPLGKL